MSQSSAPGPVEEEGDVSNNRDAYAIALGILDQALQEERRRSFDDGAVKGGLDRLLARLDSERRLPPGSPLARAVQDLSRLAYASLAPAGRAQWVGNLTALLTRQRAEAAAPKVSPTAATRTAKRPRDATATSEAVRPAPRREKRAAGPLTLESPVRALPGAARGMEAKLQVLGIECVRDLLYHFPHRYDDFSRIRQIAELVPGEQQTLVATIWTAGEKQMGRVRRGTELIVGDRSGNLRIVFFNQPYLATRFRAGATVILSGKVTLFQSQRQMDSPEWEMLDESDLAQAVHTGRLVPVYPLTAGVNARTLRRVIRAALDECAGLLADPLPDHVRERARLMALPEAIRQMHYPDSAQLAEEARRRLAFDELLTLELAVLRERRERMRVSVAPVLRLRDSVRDGFLAALPFGLTAAQDRVGTRILDDLKAGRAMARLLQGDVGSGKTVVAALALLAAVANGLQAVLMAPTEILAEQHYRTLRRLLGTPGDAAESVCTCALPYLERPLRLGLLHGGMSARAKNLAQQALAHGAIDIAVGTQALIQEGVQLERLGLAVVDEQHRFGVMQRAALRDKGGGSVHLLVMTATPIPRTLALTLYGDLELSVLDEMPPGRIPVTTSVVKPEDRDHAYQFVHNELATGRQAFVICPLVEESEKLEVRAATEEFERLREHPVFRDTAIGLLHGRMKPQEKDAVMRAFAEGGYQILVSTAVVEVGIDIPNASVILIEGADRFGLAQLHQFRGRVGRGAHRSYCLLLSDRPSEEASARLQLMEEIADGFQLAEADLRLRGPGEYFGTRQSGMPDLRVARLTDVDLLEQTRAEATAILDSSASLDAEEWALLRQQVERIKRVGGEVS